MPLSIGITCFPTFGGSGIVATEIGLAMARRGHRVHFISTEVPRRLDVDVPNVFFHEVRARDYDVFPQVPYALALTSAIVRVARYEGLDVLHAHYAVPHATSGWMAREVLGGALKVVTTLHGTDITLVGSDDSYLPITRHSIERSDALTAPSEFLRRETLARFDLDVPIEVIPNFVDTSRLSPVDGPERPRTTALFGSGAPVLAHVSNFRPLKRVDRVVDVFARVAAARPCRLLLVGDGPERPRIEARVRQLGLQEHVRLVGSSAHFEALLRECAAFVLPSETESFGLAALEALACGVPVVASDVGGLPEVVRHGETGFLLAPDDVDGMAAAVLRALDDASLGARARADAVARFSPRPILDRYEALYLRLS
jgi:N-acetyl-alpha-D-glucosaminyl L-malate synthase BshA